MSKIFRLLILLSCLFITTQILAQTQVHLVRPGDTFESIARKYDVNVAALKAANPLMESCHVGAKLQIPASSQIKSVNTQTVETKMGVSKNKPVADPYQLMVNGLTYIKQNKYSKAKKQFSKALKIKDIPEAYYYRGLCNYKKSKWKQAYKDFRVASKSSSIDPKMRSDASDLYSYAYAKHEERVEQRKEAWAEVGKALGSALLVAGTVAVGVMSQAATSNNSYSSSHSDYGSSRSFYSGSSSGSTYSPRISSMSTSQFNNYIESEMIGLMALSVAQVQQQEMNEYQQFSRYNKKSDGSNYSLNEYKAMQGQALLDLKEQGVDIVADMQEQNRQNRMAQDEQNKKEKAERFERMGYNAPESKSSTTTTSTSKNTSSSTTSVKKEDVEKAEHDSRQQFKNAPVSSDDYKEVKKVTLYDRNGDTAIARMKNVELSRKGADYFIKLDNKYYLVTYSNWGKFNRSIIYGSISLYFNL